MIHGWTRGARVKLALPMLLAISLAAPARALAPVDLDDGEDSWRKVLAYAHCAFLVFRAVGPADWAAALLDCTHTYMAESGLTAGGGS